MRFATKRQFERLLYRRLQTAQPAAEVCAAIGPAPSAGVGAGGSMGLGEQSASPGAK